MSPEERESWRKLFESMDFAGYQEVEYLGGGNFSLVFAATAPNSDSVALKILLPGHDSDDLIDFQVESALLAKLSRASAVVDLIESGSTPIPVEIAGTTVQLTLHFVALERASGCLEELVVPEDVREKLPWSQRLALWRGAVVGVHQMHLKGIVHRDLKSSNCLLFVRGRLRTDCKLSDLGRARDLAESGRVPPQNYLIGRGDLTFAPPELLLLQGVDSAEGHKSSDLYGLGSLLFELATGLGITQLALGFGPDLVRESFAARARGEEPADIGWLRARYEPAYEAFASEVPKVIQPQATALLRQLCDPEPSLRLPRRGIGRRGAAGDGLEWLIRQADILSRRVGPPASSGVGSKGVPV